MAGCRSWSNELWQDRQRNEAGDRECPFYVLLMIAEATYTITLRGFKTRDEAPEC